MVDYEALQEAVDKMSFVLTYNELEEKDKCLFKATRIRLLELINETLQGE